MDKPPKDTSDIVPRKYQLELLEDAKNLTQFYTYQLEVAKHI